MLRNPNIPYFPLIMQLSNTEILTNLCEKLKHQQSVIKISFTIGVEFLIESPSFITKLPSLHYLFWNTIANKIMLFCMPNNVSGYYQKREPMHFFIIKLLFFLSCIFFFSKNLATWRISKLIQSLLFFISTSNLIVLRRDMRK